MVSPGEIAALEGALNSYRAYAQRLADVAADASLFSLLGSGARMSQIAEDAWQNVERFRERRDELVTAEPTDHEAITAYVEAIAHATGTDLARAMAAEVQATDPARFVAAVAGDTASDVRRGLTFTGAALAVAGLLYLLLTLTRRD